MDPREELQSLRRAYDGLSQSMAELVSLKGITRHLISARDESEVVPILLDSIKDVLKFERVEFYSSGEEDGLFARPEGEGGLLPSQEILDWILKEKKSTTVPLGDDLMVTVYPLLMKDYCLGIVSIDTTNHVEGLTPQKLEILSTLADHAAVALMNARLFTQQHKHVSLLNNILDSITNGILVAGVDGKITILNRNAMAMLDLSVEAAIGKHYKDVLPSVLALTVEQMVSETLQMGFAMEQQVTHKLSQGQEIPIAVSTSLLRDEALSTMGVIVVLRDMTASRELERLRKLDLLKSEFVANVSHELKTPLTSIRAYTEALTDMVTDEQQKSFLKVIEEESDRLLFLISDLLNISKIQSGRLKLNLTLVHPRTVVDEILGISKVQSTKHRIILNFSEYLEEMLMDKERMKEVMINMVSNAIKYSPNGGDVAIAMDVFESNLKIEVKDQGMGISKENIEHIFEQFYRVDSSLTASIGGTGLGLAIVKSIIETHGGIIRCDSVVGAGSTFTILLPIRKEIRKGEMSEPLQDSFID